ncbi:hypothetical protein F4604DRAFT_1305506 [Suillus subluteus]|nr:hypothetical protein F4604DRAFT_1305506 [Suillus subluteus]
MSSFPGRGLPTLHTQSQSAASHHTETCNVVIFGETGAGKSSLINLVAGTSKALISCDATGCTTETNGYDVLIQNETLKVKLFDTVGLGEGPEGKVPDKDARRILKKLLRDLMKHTGIHLLMYCVRGVRATKALCRNYDLIRSEVKERVPIVLVATSLEDKGPEMEEWWRDNERSISNFGMTFAGHACVTTVNIDKYAEDKLKRRHKQSYHAVCQLIEQCRLSERAQTPQLDVGRWLHVTIQQVSTMTTRKKHKDIVLAEETAASAGSLANLMVAEEVTPTAPDLRLCTLQYIETVDLYDEIRKAFETIRLEDPHLEINEHSIPPKMGPRNNDQGIILAGETATSVGSHVDLMAGDEAAPTTPDMQCRMLQCSEAVDSDDETFEAIETIRLEDPHIGMKEYPITRGIDDGNNDVVLAGETAASDGSRANQVVGGGVADIGCRMLQCSEIVNSDGVTSEAFETIPFEDPHPGIREPTLTSRNDGIVLARKTAASNGSLVNLMEGDVVARTAPDVRRHVLQRSETVHLDDKTSKAFLRLVEPCLRIRGYTIIPPQIGTRNKNPSIVFFRRLEELHMGITAFRVFPGMYARCVVFRRPCTTV